MELTDEIMQREPSLTLEWSILEAPDLRRQLIEQFKMLRLGQGVTFKASLDLETVPSTNSVKHTVQLHNLQQSVNLRFQGLLPSLSSTDKLDPGLAKIITELRDATIGSSTAVQWLTSVRATPPRNQPYPGSAPSTLKPDGSGALASLAYNGSLLREVSKWFEQHVGLKLVVVPMADQFQVALETMRDPSLRVPIADAGEGLIQAIPVLVAAGMAGAPSDAGAQILAIEEPESHLHPKLHAALAKRFCELAAQSNPPQIVLETHSENILLEIQIQIASSVLQPERVIVYWVRNYENGQGRIEPIEFDAAGQPKPGMALPRGVFAEDIALSKLLFEKQQSKLAL